MNFKVGDRVKRVEESPFSFVASEYGRVGRTGIVVGLPPERFLIDVRYDDGETVNGCWAARFAPLTPPASDTWADEKVREVTKPTYLEPERVKEKTV